jgi:hypothetical protein
MSKTTNIPQELREHAASRTELVVNKIKSTMKKIEAEVEANEGIYPFNGGRLTQAELCRRAKIHKVTLQGAAHKKTTRKDIATWIGKMTKLMLSGSKAVRKAVTQRAEDWRKLYLTAVRKTDLYHIEAVAQESARAAAELRIAELERENQDLRVSLSKGKVTQLRRQKNDSQ